MISYRNVRAMNLDELLSEQSQRVSDRCKAWNTINALWYNRLLAHFGLHTIGQVPTDTRLVEINSEIARRKSVRTAPRKSRLMSNS